MLIPTNKESAMKTLLHPLLLVLVVLLSATLTTQAQANDPIARANIIAFLKAVYQSNLPVADVAKQYVALSTAANEFSTEKRYELIGHHIQMLREGNSMSTPGARKPTVERVTVVPYHKLSKAQKAQAVAFEADAEQLQHIYAAIENGAVIRYFVYQNDKISSFDYLMKGSGGPRYFIGY